ncbi:MAG: hypothetical protein AAF501_01475 [Pseudomonadota bacterium]
MIDHIYRNAGAPRPFISEQEVNLRAPDLLVLLDPKGLRASVTGGTDANELDRAISVFDRPENNGSVEGQAGQVSCPQSAPTPARASAPTLTVKTTIKRTETKTETYALRNGALAQVGQTTTENQIDSVQKTELTARNKVRDGAATSNAAPAPNAVPPSADCAVQKRMRERRNLISDQLLTASNAICARYMHAVSRYNSDANFTLSLASLGLGAAGGLIEGASQALSIASGAVGAIPTAINESYFAAQSLTSVRSAIETSRTMTENRIRVNYSRPVSDYNVAGAINDAVKYHALCSVDRGLTLVSGTVTPFNIQRVLGAARQAGQGGGEDGGQGTSPS